MEFRAPEPPLSEAQIDEYEAFLGLRFPRALKESYLSSNGGAPKPYIFEGGIGTVVSEFLPLSTEDEDQDTAIEVYKDLVLGKSLVPITFFPFAVDGGGDYFFTDTETSHGAVYFYNSDTAFADNVLVDLELGIAEFWAALTPEEED